MNSVSFTSVDLPEPETPVTQVKSPSGNSASTFLRLLPVAPITLMTRFGSRGVRSPGSAIFVRPERYLPVSESGWVSISCRRALRDDLAAMHAGARADVEHRVCGANGFLIVFDHQHRIAEVAQVFERG